MRPMLSPVASYLAGMKLWNHSLPLPDSEVLLQALVSIRSSLNDERERLEELQGENTYAHAHNIANQLIQVRNDLTRI